MDGSLPEGVRPNAAQIRQMAEPVLSLHIWLDGDAALVHTRESGRTWKGKDRWTDAECLNHVQRVDGKWRLIGQIHDVEQGA